MAGVIGRDATLEGEIRQADRIEVYGGIRGSVTAMRLVVHPGGRVYGTVRVAAAEVHGALEGDIAVRELIEISAGGKVKGRVKYGRISMETGAELDADMRNVPPEISGDFELTVRRGGWVRLTTSDLNAYDVESSPVDLTYAVSGVAKGRIVRAKDSTIAIDRFTQFELAGGAVLFVHDGSSDPTTSFSVTVTDQAGASTAPRQVSVAVV
jgi:cytoskeletal protein CcmA (bactofilin family)